MTDPEDGANGPADCARLREGPQLFVVDDSLTVLFSSAAQSVPASASLTTMLCEAVERYRSEGARFCIFEDQIVRVQPLAGADGSHSYAVLMQRFSPADMSIAVRARFGLSGLEARVLEVLLRGDDAATALAPEATPGEIAAALSVLRQKTDGMPTHALLESLLDAP